MASRVTLVALVATVLGTGAYALAHDDPPPPAQSLSGPSSPSQATVGDPSFPGSEDFAQSTATALPPGHPPISGGAQVAMPPPAEDEAASITWKVPGTWLTTANPSSMRLATYRIPHTGADTEDAEMSVMRAGGGVDANLQRWVGQFDDAGKDERADKTVHGVKVTIVEVAGTYMGGSMTPGASSQKRRGWALMGAIVEGKGTPYFFKMTGPVATVRAARAQFQSLIESLTPS